MAPVGSAFAEGLSLGIMGGSRAGGKLGAKVKEAEEMAKKGHTDRAILNTTGAVRSSENKFVAPIEFTGEGGLNIKIGDDKGEALIRKFDPSGGIESSEIIDTYGIGSFAPVETEGLKIIRGQKAIGKKTREKFGQLPVVSDIVEFDNYFDAYPEVASIPVIPTTIAPGKENYPINIPSVLYDPKDNVFYARMKVRNAFSDGNGAPEFDREVTEGDDWALALQSYVSNKEGLVPPEKTFLQMEDESRPFYAGGVSPRAEAVLEDTGPYRTRDLLNRDQLIANVDRRLDATREKVTTSPMYESRASVLRSY